jgi:uncharacterized protein YlxW (UPF0749 family)
MRRLVIGVVVVSVVLAVLCMPYCVRQMRSSTDSSDNATKGLQPPNLTIPERQRLLEEKVSDLTRVIDQMQRENAQLRRDLEALSNK